MTTTTATTGATLDRVDAEIKAIIDNLYVLVVQSYDHQGPLTTEATTEEIKSLVKNLLALCQTSRQLDVALPPEVVDYVERSRNPDIYTREFVELVQRLNQQLKGRSEAYADFADVLAAEMTSALPDEADAIRALRR